MRLSGYVPVDVTPWETASGGKAIACTKQDVCSATVALQRPAGRYDIAVRYFDYLHGVSTYTLSLNDKIVAEWKADNTLPSDAMNGDTSTRYTLSNIELRPGDVMKIEGYPNDGEPAPLDYVEITPICTRGRAGAGCRPERKAGGEISLPAGLSAGKPQA